MCDSYRRHSDSVFLKLDSGLRNAILAPVATSLGGVGRPLLGKRHADPTATGFTSDRVICTSAGIRAM